MCWLAAGDVCPKREIPMDPLGLIGNLNDLPVARPTMPANGATERASSAPAPDFKQFLREQIDHVNRLQSDATTAVEDLATGRRDDLETVIMATRKAGIAFDMLLAVRNKVMEAYDEIKQIRV
jgi:flagellar hook-basal body complex protein FliE